MISNTFFDKKLGKIFLSNSRIIENLVVTVITSINLLLSIFNKENIFKTINSTLKNNSKNKNLRICISNYFYNVSFIYQYACLLYLRKSKLVKKISEIRSKGLEIFKSSIKSNSPIVLFTAYTGNFYYMLLTLDIQETTKGKKIAILLPDSYSTKRNLLHKKIIKYGLTNVEFIDLQIKTNVFKIRRYLKNKDIIICTLDISHHYTSDAKILFLNKMVFLPVGITHLARLYNALVIPVFLYKKKGIVEYEILPPLELSYTKNKAYDFDINSKKIVNTIEEKIYQIPSQWLMWETLSECNINLK